jgi:hypothetical protein
VDVGKQDCNEIIQDLRALEVENNELLQEKQNLIPVTFNIVSNAPF